MVILAPLVFGEALTSSIDLRRVRRPGTGPGGGLVVAGARPSVRLGRAVPGIRTSMAFALGAILGPTTRSRCRPPPVQGGSAQALANILEGESLVNDGTALTLLRVFLAVGGRRKRDGCRGP